MFIRVSVDHILVPRMVARTIRQPAIYSRAHSIEQRTVIALITNLPPHVWCSESAAQIEINVVCSVTTELQRRRPPVTGRMYRYDDDHIMPVVGLHV